MISTDCTVVDVVSCYSNGKSVYAKYSILKQKKEGPIAELEAEIPACRSTPICLSRNVNFDSSAPSFKGMNSVGYEDHSSFEGDPSILCWLVLHQQKKKM